MPTDDELGTAPTISGTPTQASQPTAPGGSGEMPSVIADRYEILGLLGVGGMGRVYRAHDRALDEVVALKLLRRELAVTPGAIERFRQEVKLARKVTSPHVVRTFDLGEHGDDHFLTMEYVEGRSLAQLLDDGQLAIDEIMRIARAVAAGIAAAHATGVLHRDLKPDNVLVAKDGRIAITDFGIARAAATPTTTADGFVGTPAYMAPEQVEAGTPIGPPADVYAFGAIMFEMLAGQRPFSVGDMLAVALARLRQPPPDPRAFRAVPAALAEFVLHCMAREPAARFADGRALVGALAGLHDLTAPPVSATPAFAVPTKSSRSVALLPLRGAGELAEIADGLSEEIVDALSMTRALRVRPLASVRNATRPGADTREIGRTLGVDVVVDGSIRQRGDGIRISARVIGVADGFQLWASHFDASADNLLTTSDEVVRAIASALTVELDMPARPIANPRVTERYLEAKARLRTRWMVGGVEKLIHDLEETLVIAPDDPGILAVLAMATARSAYYGGIGTLERARELAARAITHAPGSGEAYLAFGVANLYGNEHAEGARALVSAIERSPGLAMAQSMLGSVALEAGALDGAIAHLAAAMSLDPQSQPGNLARAYVYAGRRDEAIRLLAHSPNHIRELATARYAMWHGELYTVNVRPTELPPDFRLYGETVARIHRTRTMTPEDRAAMEQAANVSGARLRATRAQFMVEYLMFVGDVDGALRYVELAVDAGLQDFCWIARCPLLAPLHQVPRFGELAAIVGERARAVLAVLSHR